MFSECGFERHSQFNLSLIRLLWSLAGFWSDRVPGPVGSQYRSYGSANFLLPAQFSFFDSIDPKQT